MKELKEIAHRITQCDEVGGGGEKNPVKWESNICQPLYIVYHITYKPSLLHAVFSKWTTVAVAKLSA